MTERFENGYAVVIGVDENQMERLALPTVAKDVQAVYDVLVHPERCAYKEANVKLLKGSQSTQQNILDALLWLQDKVKADAEATAVLYYSGHGMVDKKTDQYYLIPYDIKGLARVRADAIKAETLIAEISDIAAKRMLAILDCCHAAGMKIKDVDLDALDDAADVVAAPFPIDQPETKDIPDFTAVPGAKAVGDLLDGEGRAILNSSTGAQSSYVRRDGQMSLFTYHLIEALTGHAPHPDDATVVYVTDVMSWVTHEVKKSAKSEGVDQTPVMRTSGVFPVAQLIGGLGVAKGLGAAPPDPLAPLPPATISVGGDVSGAIVSGNNNSVTQIHGDQVQGDNISVGNISGSTGVAIGRGASANVNTFQGSANDLNALFAPLQTAVAAANPALVGKVGQLKALVAQGANADDNQVAGLIEDIAEGAPPAAAALKGLFQQEAIAAAAGPAANYVLSRIKM